MVGMFKNAKLISLYRIGFKGRIWDLFCVSGFIWCLVVKPPFPVFNGNEYDVVMVSDVCKKIDF